jgi:hypothetical protein
VAPKPRDLSSRCCPTSELVPGSSSVVIRGGDESDGFTNSLVKNQ